jgi:hypothetical protein
MSLINILINILKMIVSLLKNQADLLAILIFVFALELLVLLLTIRMKQVKVKVFSDSTNRYSKLHEIIVFPTLINLGFMLILIKNFILFASYDASMNFVGLEPLLSLIVVVLIVYLMQLVLKHETKFSLILLFSIVFGVLYVLNVDPFSQKIFTDRILAATYVVEKGIYPSGLLDKAYDPIPFDVTIYSFLALILGIEPASILIFLMYPTLSLAITYAVTWLLMVRYAGGIGEEHDTVKIAFIIVFLSQISCWALTITSHEALWSAWLLIALAEYSLLKILGNKNAGHSTTIIFLILVLASLFYHITVSTVLLSLIIAFITFMHIYGFQAIRIKVLFSLFAIYTILSFIKTYFIAEYPFSAFFSLLKTVLLLQFSEELAVYVRANILKSTNIYLRYAQSSPSLVAAIGLASTLFYIVRIFGNKTVKGKNTNETVISLSLSSTGLILLFMSFLSIFVQGTTYSTTFLRPALFLLLLGAIPYVIEKAKIICNNRKLFLIQAIMLIVIVGLAVNDVSVTPRKGLYSPFIYVNSLDVDNLHYLNYVINNNIAIIGYPEVSTYLQYLNIKYDYNLTTIGSSKDLRKIYMDLYKNQRIQDNLHGSLLVSINEFNIRPILFMLDEYSPRIYNSNIYVIHYIC